MSERARKLIEEEYRAESTEPGHDLLEAAERVVERFLRADEERRCAEPLDCCADAARRRERLEDRMDRMVGHMVGDNSRSGPYELYAEEALRWIAAIDAAVVKRMGG